MNKLHAIGTALSAALILVIPTAASAGSTGYVLGNGGTTLHVFDLSTPGTPSTISLSLSGAGASLDDIDFRPLTGQLYGYDDVADRYFTVNVNTGELTLASSAGVTPTGSDKVGIDFNPVIDRLRTVSELGENIVYNPNNGTASDAATVPLFYAAGDANAGVAPQIVANAYTNSAFGVAAATTVQYVLDANLNALATLANNTGVLSTIAQVTLNGAVLDFESDAGFDILAGPGGSNTAYAVLNVGSLAGLYTIDLATGAASLVGALPDGFGTIRGLAVAPNAVPEPSSIVLAGLAAAGIAAYRVRGARRASRD
ncbi:DUF4394 domain-containing protein [Paludisphaera soli]|uniref:DUF4394 domain-containing protein n=1 Tax=Paludisphaera soli TaxID=2712865 RepID=UPI0013EC9B46|nr:DUF4394 domain-containing protein [Paludisphaera soli]